MIHDVPILVLGAGVTGKSIVKFLGKNNLSSCVWDGNARSATEMDWSLYHSTFIQEIDQWQGHIAITSPGLPMEGVILSQLKSRGVEIFSDIDLFSIAQDRPMIAVTGTNGKSSVVTALEHVTAHLGMHWKVGGNLGPAALSILDEKADGYILEVSSYQLAHSRCFSATLGVVINIDQDHLDWHQGLLGYQEAKLSLLHGRPAENRKTLEDLLQANVDHKGKSSQDEKGDRQSIDAPAKGGHRVTQGLLNLDDPFLKTWSLAHSYDHVDCYSKKILDDMASSRVEKVLASMSYAHGVATLSAVLAIAQRMGWPMDQVLSLMATYQVLPHRCQNLGMMGARYWINDSKATNLHAAFQTLKVVHAPMSENNHASLFALMGGSLKGQQMADDSLPSFVEKVIAFGEDGPRIKAQFGERVVLVQTLEEAVQKAMILSRPGDTVVLAPGGSSHDAFANFAKRGEAFQRYVEEYANV